MKDLDKSGLWKMLRDPKATASIEQADLTLLKFANGLHQFCREEPEPDERFRSLVFFRSMITAPCDWAQGEAKHNGLPAYLSGVAAQIIDGELELVKLEMQFPSAFLCKRKVATPLAGWDGTQNELLEMHRPLHKMGKMLKPDGKPMAYSDVIVFLLNAYGVEIAGAYDRNSKLLTRVKRGAPFLEKVLQVFLEEVDEKLK